MINPGIYRMHFKGGPSQNFGDGIVILKDGKLNGADPGYTYRGSFEITEDKITAKISVSRWNPAVTNPILNVTEYDLTVEAPAPSDWASFSVPARVVQYPQIPPISIEATRLADTV